MNGDKGRRSIGEHKRLPAHLGDRDDAPEQAARRGRAERYNCLRSHDGALAFEPPFAAIDFMSIRALVQAALAAHLMFEVFDRIGDEHILALDAGLLQRLIQEAAGRTDKWATGEILLVAWLLADQHQTRMCSPLARHNLGGELIERAARATGF